MAELGDEVGALHERVGAHAADRVDVLLVGGEFADATRARRASAQGSPRSASCASRRMPKPRAGCARTRAPATSCCSRARASTSWRRSSRSCARERRDARASPSRGRKCRPDWSRFRCARRSCARRRSRRASSRDAVRGIARPGDVVAVSETAVAIAQGEFVRRRIRSSVAARVRALAPRRCARDGQSAGIDAARDRSTPAAGKCSTRRSRTSPDACAAGAAPSTK